MPPATRTAVAASGLAVAIAGLGAFAWQDAERRALASAEAEARALLGAVAAGIDANLESARVVAKLVGDHLAGLVPEVDARLAVAPESGDAVLGEFAASRGLRGAVWLGDDLSVRAVSVPARPYLGDRSVHADSRSPTGVARIEAAALARRAEAAGLPRERRVDLGLRDSPFGARTEVAVAVRAEAAGGFVLLRDDAQFLARFRSEAGIERLSQLEL